jgi:hypothetical protein
MAVLIFLKISPVIFILMKDVDAFSFSLLQGHLLLFQYTVCPQSPLGVLKNCGAQTN